MNVDQKYARWDDSTVVRDGVGSDRGLVTLVSEDRECLFQFPAEWTDEQIKYALAFANKAYAAGYSFGQFRKAAEVRAAIGVSA